MCVPARRHSCLDDTELNIYKEDVINRMWCNLKQKRKGSADLTSRVRDFHKGRTSRTNYDQKGISCAEFQCYCHSVAASGGLVYTLGALCLSSRDIIANRNVFRP